MKMTMKLKIFLASSSELREDRERFEILINRRNKLNHERSMFIHLEIWEDFLDCITEGGLQKAYNQSIRLSDIFVLLAHNKVGTYTDEEFDTAFRSFSEKKKPRIFTYLKKPNSDQNPDEKQSLEVFKAKLKSLNHYWSNYDTTAELLLDFGKQLDKVLQDKTFVGDFAIPQTPSKSGFSATIGDGSNHNVIIQGDNHINWNNG